MSVWAFNKAAGAIATVFLIASLSGCANPNLDELERYVEAEKAKPLERIESLPEIKQISTYIFEAKGRRDPFMPVDSDQGQEASFAGNGISPNPNRRKEELEGYSLDAIRMVGILEQSGIIWGLVKTKEGIIHRVRSGNYMGQNHGRIIQVTEDKIDLTEIVQDGTGGYSERQASLALAE